MKKNALKQLNFQKINTKFYKEFGAKGLASLVSTWRTKDDFKIIKKLSKKTDRILDLACGYGRVTIPIAKAGYNIIGLDLSPDLIKEARKTAKKTGIKIRFDIGNMIKTPYKANNFDKIFCLWSSFTHIFTKKDQLKALNEIFRILNKDGLAFIEMPNRKSKLFQRQVRKEGQDHKKRIIFFIYKKHKSPMYMHDRKSIAELCKKSKFAHFKICMKNLNNRRRLVVYLYK